MGSRGGGRGRGRFGGGSFRFAKQEPFVHFPDIELPSVDSDKVQKSIPLLRLRITLQKEIKNLPYFLEDAFTDEKESVDIERYSDKEKTRYGTRVSLENSGYMILEPGYFPLELVRGTKHRTGRRVQWNPTRGLKKLDHLEELEKRFKDGDFEGKKGKDDEEDEEEDVEEELEEEDEDEGDYEMMHDNQDDEDDYNLIEEDDDEGLL
ncbi:hypothetical protein vseg_008554 [Gypsophila vaccaria]